MSNALRAAAVVLENFFKSGMGQLTVQTTMYTVALYSLIKVIALAGAKLMVIYRLLKFVNHTQGLAAWSAGLKPASEFVSCQLGAGAPVS